MHAAESKVVARGLDGLTLTNLNTDIGPSLLARAKCLLS